VGTILDDFELLGVLGGGTFGQVYLARQVSLGRQVALKVTPNLGNEARTLAQLEHDHIVQVFAQSIDAARNLQLLCMQYVPGTTLQRVMEALSRRPREQWNGRVVLEIIDAVSTMPAALDPAALRDREFLAACDFVEASCWFGARLAEALAHAHSHGVLHRDVKPANILVSRYGRPYLADFSVAATARRADAAGDTFGGTLAYMAPEHLEAFATTSAPDAVREAADIYSLGVVLYELLVGRLPFEQPAGKAGSEDDALNALIAQRRAGPPALPREAAVPQTVARLLQRCLEPQPPRRYSSAAELARALDGCRELRRMDQELPPPGPMTSLLGRWPFALGFVLIVLPQLLGSVVNVSYNKLRIIERLTSDQHVLFERLVLAYNVVAYPVCLVILACLMLPIRSVWQRLERSAPLDACAVEGARRRALRLPRWAVVLSCFGWLPGGLLFPLGLRYLSTAPVGFEVYGHFLISFTVSGLIALTYSFLVIQFLVLRVLYPRLWIEAGDMQPTARAELRGIDRRLALFPFVAALIPLAGALLMICVGPDPSFRGEDYQTFRLLVTALIALGMTGLGVAIGVTSLLRRTVAVLMGAERG
jgi:serine/threonine protein kinase